ncbi:MAG: phage tail tip lysozyme, partial [Eubacteriales bacterium]|nr:phage tail tip lysozyme [Eubacteriales bacterium]
MNTAAEKKAYEIFIKAGMTPAGACGLIGNLEAESDGFYPNRVEYLCIKRMKEAGQKYLTDEAYTKAVDDGSISAEQFLHPLPGKQYGFGLAQWTSPGRKAGLYNLAKQKGVSIADLDMQIEFLLSELQTSYATVLKVLKTTSSIREASDIVLKKFEIPANTGESVCVSRATRGQKFYDNYVEKEETTVATNDNAINAVLAIAEAEIGYLEKKSNAQLDSKTANAGSANYTKYWRDLYPQFQAQAWCAIFVTWCMVQAFGQTVAKALLKHYPFTYVPTLAGMTSNTQPKRGDVVCFYRNGTFTHTGFVTAVSGNTIKTIE